MGEYDMEMPQTVDFSRESGGFEWLYVIAL